MFSFWYDPWFQGHNVKDVFPNLHIPDTEIPKWATVSDVWRQGRWCFPDSIDEETKVAWEEIKKLSPRALDSDSIWWKHSRTGVYSVKSAWDVIRPRNPQVPWYKLVWGLKHISKCSFILWLALHNKLATKLRLLSWGMVNDANCIFCHSASESIDHLYFACPFTNAIWQHLLAFFQIHRLPLRWRREISWFTRRTRGKTRRANTRRVLLAATVYWIWRERNDAIFERKPPSADMVIRQIKHYVLLKLEHISDR